MVTKKEPKRRCSNGSSGFQVMTAHNLGAFLLHCPDNPEEPCLFHGRTKTMIWNLSVLEHTKDQVRVFGCKKYLKKKTGPEQLPLPWSRNRRTVSSGHLSGANHQVSLSRPIINSNSQRKVSNWTDWVTSPPFGHRIEGPSARPFEIKEVIADSRTIHKQLQETREWVVGRQKPQMSILGQPQEWEARLFTREIDLAALEHLGISFPAFSGSPRVSLKPKPMAGMGRQDMSLRELELIAPIVECPKLRKYYYQSQQLLGIYPDDILANMLKDVYSRLFIAALFITAKFGSNPNVY